MPNVDLIDVSVVGLYDGPFLNGNGIGSATIDSTGTPSAVVKCGVFTNELPKLGAVYSISGKYDDHVKPPIAFQWQNMECTRANAPDSHFERKA